MEQQDQLEETIVQSMNRTILVTQVFLLFFFSFFKSIIDTIC